MSKSLSAQRHTHRPGLTLVEVLVIVSIFGMLTAIALPAVNRARESGRRNTCTNRFRQFGTAVVAFEATQGAYPLAWGSEAVFRGKPRNPSWEIGPHVYLLPHLDLNDLYQSFHLPQMADNVLLPYYLTVTTERVATFRCPSDPEELPRDDFPGTNIRVTWGSYKLDATQKNSTIAPGPTTGAFHLLRFCSSADVVDGISRTAAASEKLLGSGGAGVFDRRRDLWYAGVPFYVHDVDQMAAICGSLTTPSPKYCSIAGARWSEAGFARTCYNHAVTPNANIPDCDAATQPQLTGNWDLNIRQAIGSYRATSNHPGGVNVVFLDAHTEFVINDVELPVWRALATIAGRD